METVTMDFSHMTTRLVWCSVEITVFFFKQKTLNKDIVGHTVVILVRYIVKEIICSMALITLTLGATYGTINNMENNHFHQGSM